MKIAISAAETSGDLIASSLVKSLKAISPKYEIDGLAGNKMIEAGCKSLWHTDEINVMGISEVVKKLPQVLGVRKSIISYYSLNKPDVFIGVDSPDFNFKIEKKLRRLGVKTIHLVSPSVWAWRAKRIKKIKESTDLILCLFPFEVDFYRKHNQKALFIGHPLAEKLSPRKNYKANKQVLLMPGSREAEIKTLLPELVSTVILMRQNDPELKFSMSLANDHHKEWVEREILDLNIDLSVGDAYEKIKEADLVIVASGTATLEVALIGVPMIVTYKLSFISYQIVKRLLNTEFISLPNKILGKAIVPELIQDKVNGKKISNIAMQLITSDSQPIVSELRKIHGLLNQNSSAKSVDAVIKVINE